MKAMPLLISLFLFSQISLAQNRVFEVEKHDYSVKVIEIQSEEKIDLNFYRKNFNIHNFLPSEYINPKFKNETVVKWNDEEGDKDYMQNWTFTYTYDEYSRVVKYEYSGCFVCSQFPYEVQIKYDENNRPIELIESYKTFKELNPSDTIDPNLSEFRIEYNEKDEVRKLSIYGQGQMIRRIELMN